MSSTTVQVVTDGIVRFTVNDPETVRLVVWQLSKCLPALTNGDSSSSNGSRVMRHGVELPPGQTISSLAKEYGLSPKTLSGRLHRGITLEEALQKTLMPRLKRPRSGPVLYEGKTYGEWKAVYGLPPGLSNAGARSRLKKGGWSIKDAFTVPKDGKRP